MGFIPEITCRRCGNKFSAIHSRCPKCGAPRKPQADRPAAEGEAAPAAPAEKRSGSGKTAPLFNSNTKWQFIFGCILILLVIVAVIVLISASLGPPAKPVETPDPTVEVTTPPPTTPPPTTPPPTIPVTSITIVTAYDGRQTKGFTLRDAWGPLQLKADVYPVEALTTASVKWRSSNEEVCTVDETGLVTAVGDGSCEIIAECGGVAAKCDVIAFGP